MYQIFLGWRPTLKYITIYQYPRDTPLLPPYSEPFYLSPDVDFERGNMSVIFHGEFNKGNRTFKVFTKGKFYIDGDPKLYELRLRYCFHVLVYYTEDLGVEKYYHEPSVYISINNRTIVHYPAGRYWMHGGSRSTTSILGRDTIPLHHFPDMCVSGWNDITITTEVKLMVSGKVKLICTYTQAFGVVKLHDRDLDLIADCVIDVIPINNILLILVLTGLYLTIVHYRSIKRIISTTLKRKVRELHSIGS